MKVVRKIIEIDDDLCDGCGNCVPSCAEGALEIIDGKAKVIADIYCDGLGACLGECPTGALSIVEREADEFDEDAVEDHLAKQKKPEPQQIPMSGGCPSARMQTFDSFAAQQATTTQAEITTAGEEAESALSHWPVQIMLVPPTAPFLKGADLVLSAHCVPFAYAGFHQDFLGDNTALLVACPKLDDYQAHQKKLDEILEKSGIKSLTVLHMEVPCCSGLVQMARQAILNSGNVVPFRDITINVRGECLAG